ncbi:MAG: hypothetical protein JW395_3666 [Nitrospira sp.]|nr:hypothetical protein [Nitrospira sp.]
MAKHSPSEVTVTFDDAPGGTARIITPYVTTIGGLAIEAITQQTNPFGVTTESHTPVGLTKVSDIAIGGFFDDTASVGPHVVFQIAAADYAPASAGRSLVIVAATAKTFTITVHLVKYEVMLKKDGLTEYQALVRQKSTGVWS